MSDLGIRSPQRRWVVPTVLFVGLCVLYGLTIGHTDVLINPDLRTTYYAAWHLSMTGSPWLDHVDIPGRVNIATQNVWILQAANGHTVVGRAPGVIAASIPAYFLSRPDRMTFVPGGLTAAFMTAGTVTLLFLTLRSHLERRTALLAALVFGLTTPVWSVCANGLWPHTVTLLGIVGMAWAATSRRWWLVGLFGGVGIWGRIHVAVIVAILGLYVAWRRREPGIAVRVGATSTASLALMSGWVRWMYGTWNPTSFYDTEYFDNYAASHKVDLVNQLGFWVSPDRGILVFTPVLLVLLPALVRGWRDLPDWSRALVWGGLVYTVLQGVFNRFSGGDIFFGYRYGLEFLACVTPAVALSAPRMGRVARVLIGPVIGLQLLAFTLGSVSDSVWLPLWDAWDHNAFVFAIDGMGVAGWVMVAWALGMGVLGTRIWTRWRPGPMPGVSDDQAVRPGVTAGT